MISSMERTQEVASPAERRYRDAEATLWAAHGLEPAEHWVELRDPACRIRVVEVGSGSPLLLVPGSGGTGPYWAPLAGELAAGRRLLMIDRPGWGLSSPIDYRADAYPATAAALLGGVMDQLGLEGVDMVGASVGGNWALDLAHAQPSRVRRIALLGGILNAEVPTPTFIKLLRSPVGAVIVRLPMKPGMLRKQLEGLGHGASAARGAMDGFMSWRLAFQRETHSMRHERDMVRAIVGPDGFRDGALLEPGEMAALRQPVLMVFGTDDPTGTSGIWERFVARIPGGKLQLVPEAGHMPWWDRPADVGRQVREFLAG
jgi:pimeloyl-ACP methyl ester carboxylesterase